MAFSGKYAPSYRRMNPYISVSGIENVEQARALISHFYKTNCKSHRLELAVLASQLTLHGIKTDPRWLLRTEISQMAREVSEGDKSLIFSVHFANQNTEGLSKEKLAELNTPTSTDGNDESWRQLNRTIEVSGMPGIFERSHGAAYGVQANLGWDEGAMANFRRIKNQYSRIETCMEVRDTASAILLHSYDSIDHLVVNLPHQEGKGFDAESSVSAAVLFLTQNPYLTMGFVGGLRPETIGVAISGIAHAAHTTQFSVGLESGVRTDGKFDTGKAMAAISTATEEFRKLAQRPF